MGFVCSCVVGVFVCARVWSQPLDSRLRGNDGVRAGNDGMDTGNDGVRAGNDGMDTGNDGVRAGNDAPSRHSRVGGNLDAVCAPQVWGHRPRVLPASVSLSAILLRLPRGAGAEDGGACGDE